MFMAHQMIADVEELVSGKNGRGRSPFGGNFIWAGYGGTQGFIALDHISILNRDCEGPGYKRWHVDHSPPFLRDVWENLLNQLENELDQVHLSLLGLQKVDGKGVVIALTGRILGFTDIEHMLCKVYLACTRARGSRNHGASRAWRNFCWPSIIKYTVWSLHLEATINHHILEQYKQAILQPSDTGPLFRPVEIKLDWFRACCFLDHQVASYNMMLELCKCYCLKGKRSNTCTNLKFVPAQQQNVWECRYLCLRLVPFFWQLYVQPILSQILFFVQLMVGTC
jgi:hypothetical protein